MRSNFTSWSDALLLWCNENSIVGFKLVYMIAIIILAISTPLLYILWKNPGYFHSIYVEIPDKTIYLNIVRYISIRTGETESNH